MEAFLYGGHRLCTHLCILFNAFLKFGYVPSNFSLAAIVPLVKNKSGDLCDANNYRAIALSNAISKILESLLCDYIESIDDVDLYQFGFSRSLSTGVFLMRSKTLLTFTDKMAVMYSVVLLISTKHLTVLTTGCCSVNCSIAMILMSVT